MNQKIIDSLKYLLEVEERRHVFLKMYQHELRQERAQRIFNEIQQTEEDKCDCSICKLAQCPFRKIPN